MPLWQIYHPPSTFTTPESKHALASSITKIYTSPPASLPPFYVVVNFIPVPQSNTFIGGAPASTYSSNPTSSDRPFIRFVVDHIAIRLPDEDAAYARTTARIDEALKEHVADRGYDWEYHVVETERRLWKINGMAPPEWGSDGERRWREVGRPFVLE